VIVLYFFRNKGIVLPVYKARTGAKERLQSSHTMTTILHFQLIVTFHKDMIYLLVKMR